MVERQSGGWIALFGFALCVAAPVADAQTEPVATPQPVSMESLATDSRRILETYCVRCHGDDTQAGSFGSVRSVDGLVRGGIILRGRPDDSPLIQRLRPAGDMPLRGDAPSEVERETLRRWIRAGAPASDQAAPVARRERVEERTIAQAVLDDLASIPDTARPFTRYFTLHHIHNATLGDTQWEAHRQEYEDALLVLVNSLSWQRNFHRFHAIARGLALRIDLRRLGWTDAQWDAIARRYPYAVRAGDDLYDRVVTSMGLSGGGAVPWLRADWFIANASLSPLYETLLQLPATRGELERLLRVDVAADLRQFTAGRAGFRQSGVSHNNRVIERHDTAYGAYWQSYDFADNVGRHDIFQHPLGPGAGEGEFEPSGGEIIFTLPNRLQGYLLVDGAGRRIAEAPTRIVHDATNPTDPVIRNAVSCMGCHGLDGIKPKDDEVRVAVERAGADADRVRAVDALYASGRAWLEITQGDHTQYQRALSELLPTAGGGRVPLLPVVSIARRFINPLDAVSIAAALDLPDDELRRRVSVSTGVLRQALGPVVGGSTLARDQFECAWRGLIAELYGDGAVLAGVGTTARNCGNASSTVAVAPVPRVPCQARWHQTRTFEVSADGNGWQQSEACTHAREQLRARVEPVCAESGSTMGDSDRVPCACRQEYSARWRRNFWACATTGVVACGRYEQICGGLL